MTDTNTTAAPAAHTADPKPARAPREQLSSEEFKALLGVLGESYALTGTPEAQLNFIKALACAKANFAPMKRSAIGRIGNREFKYLGLDAMIAATDGALAAEGIVLIQAPHTSPLSVLFGQRMDRLTTSLFGHGAELRFYLDFRPPASTSGKVDDSQAVKDAQEGGKHLTYLKRYAQAAVLRIDADPDLDEGDGAPAREPERRREPPAANEQPRPQRQAAPKPTAEPKPAQAPAAAQGNGQAPTTPAQRAAEQRDRELREEAAKHQQQRPAARPTYQGSIPEADLKRAIVQDAPTEVTVSGPEPEPAQAEPEPEPAPQVDEREPDEETMAEIISCMKALKLNMIKGSALCQEWLGKSPDALNHSDAIAFLAMLKKRVAEQQGAQS